MRSNSTITLSGRSGMSYVFFVFPLAAVLPPLPVIYFVYEAPIQAQGTALHQAVYVGHSGDAATCMDDHHRQCFRANRATHVALHVDYDENSRAQIAADLIAALDPVCNA